MRADSLHSTSQIIFLAENEGRGEETLNLLFLSHRRENKELTVSPAPPPWLLPVGFPGDSPVPRSEGTLLGTSSSEQASITVTTYLEGPTKASR